MTVVFVTRHDGALEWAARRGVDTTRRVEHLADEDIAALGPGDTLIGTLPIHIAAAANARGARYLHVAMEIPHAARGRNLSADEMDMFGARLEEYRIAFVSSQ